MGHFGQIHPRAAEGTYGKARPPLAARLRGGEYEGGLAGGRARGAGRGGRRWHSATMREVDA